MHVTMIGDGSLSGPLTALSRRAGHTVRHVDDTTNATPIVASDIVIVTGDRTTATTLMGLLAPHDRLDAIVVDATLRPEIGYSDEASVAGEGGGWPAGSQPASIVRAFVSVPAEAFELIVDRPESGDTTNLAVPMAGDDTAAKRVLGDFMRQIGVEPFDLGPLAVSYVMEPGGALWGKAMDDIGMRECVGWLSGD